MPLIFTRWAFKPTVGMKCLKQITNVSSFCLVCAYSWLGPTGQRFWLLHHRLRCHPPGHGILHRPAQDGKTFRSSNLPPFQRVDFVNSRCMPKTLAFSLFMLHFYRRPKPFSLRCAIWRRICSISRSVVVSMWNVSLPTGVFPVLYGDQTVHTFCGRG